jgi:CheY-like chemotaxis protein
MGMTESVLIVEDDTAIAASLERFLDNAGYSTSSAGNGKEALDELQRGLRPSVLLIDLMLPIMSGWELIERLQRDDTLSQIPVVVMSAYPKLAGESRLRDLNLPFVEKPIRLERLLGIIRNVARPSSSRWEISRIVR